MVVTHRHLVLVIRVILKLPVVPAHVIVMFQHVRVWAIVVVFVIIVTQAHAVVMHIVLHAPAIIVFCKLNVVVILVIMMVGPVIVMITTHKAVTVLVTVMNMMFVPLLKTVVFIVPVMVGIMEHAIVMEEIG